MAFSRKSLVFFTIFQFVLCHNLSHLENKKFANRMPFQKLHVFGEKIKPFLYETGGNHTYIGINYFLMKTIGEHLNTRISFDLTSNEIRFENWEPSLKCVIIREKTWFHSIEEKNFIAGLTLRLVTHILICIVMNVSLHQYHTIKINWFGVSNMLENTRFLSIFSSLFLWKCGYSL